MSAPTTPRAKTTFNPTTPVNARVSTSNIVQPSPHYQTTRRHSLYGTEDRVVIDPGSRVWKVGFSGEGRPRDVFLAGGSTTSSLWSLSRARNLDERAEEERLLEVKLELCLRAAFHQSLLTDPKSRKVILVEHPLLPLHIKDMLARILFDNLQVPSISFASSHLLSLCAVGRITGLVVDCGHLETTALPIFAARPLYSLLRTTPLAGSRLTSHLRALLLLFGTYLAPPTSLSAAANIPTASRATRVPEEVLTDTVIEEIKTRCCFVGDGLDSDARHVPTPGDELMETDVAPSDASQSESEFSHLGSNASSQQESSEFSVVSHLHASKSDHRSESHLQALADMYTRHSTATDIQMRVVPPVAQQTGTGRGTLIVPGWIRERAAEVLFEGGDVDEGSVVEVILDSLLKVPMDLRKTMVSSILVAGGTSMLPGFIPRLHAELVSAVAPSAIPSRHPTRQNKLSPPPYDRYASLRQLTPYLAILNNPVPPPPNSDRAKANAGRSPAFSPMCLAWVGGSLAGSLKTGGVEVPREKWDEAGLRRDPEASMNDDSADDSGSAKGVLPDWTQSPMPIGAPLAARRQEEVIT